MISETPAIQYETQVDEIDVCSLRATDRIGMILLVQCIEIHRDSALIFHHTYIVTYLQYDHNYNNRWIIHVTDIRKHEQAEIIGYVGNFTVIRTAQQAEMWFLL